jgi:hypothetical protein
MNVEDALAGTSTVTTRLHGVRGRVPYAAELRLFDAVAAEVGDRAQGHFLGRPTDAAELRQALLTGCDPAGVPA